METLYCQKCQQHKPAEEFSTKLGNRSYALCQECRRARNREWMRNHKKLLHRDVWSMLYDAMGRECRRCTYSEFDSALEFHALAEGTPIFNLVNRYVYSSTEYNWIMLVEGLAVHTLLCTNCRKALGAGDWIIGDSMRVGPLFPLQEPLAEPAG